MSENIKVSEVSDILRKQLEGINANVQLDEIGTVLQVSDGVVRIYGLRNAEANELLEFDNGIKAIVMNLEEDNVGAVLLGPTDRIKEGFIVKRTKRIASIRVGEGMLGRVIDPLGEPLDGKGLVGGELPCVVQQRLNQQLRQRRIAKAGQARLDLHMNDAPGVVAPQHLDERRGQRAQVRHHRL